MKYIITNEDRTVFLKDPGHVVYDIVDAEVWTKQSKAENVMKTLNINLKQKYGLIISEEFESINMDTIDNLPDINEKINEISEYVSLITKRKEYLQCQISLCDKEICDIQHAAEFYSLNACKGYKLYKMLHDITCKRREYKNEFAKLTYILNSSFSNTSMEKLQKSIYGIDNNQKYSPRVLQELFTDN